MQRIENAKKEVINVKKFNKSDSVKEFFNDTTFEDYYSDSDFKNAFDTISDHLDQDKELYYAYQSNIAMAFVDTFHNHRDDIMIDVRFQNYHIPDERLLVIANEAAKNFLNLMINGKPKS